MNPLKVAVGSSGLGHVFRGIEAWAADLAGALAARGANVTLYKGGGQAALPYERVLPCWEREADETKRLMKWLPKQFIWRLGFGSNYGIEQTTFALRLIRQLRRDPVDVLHVQDPHVARILVMARRFGLVKNATILAHGTNEPWAYLAKFPYLQHLAPWHLEQGRVAGCWRPEWTAISNFIDTDLYRPGQCETLRGELGISPHDVVILTAAAIKREHKRVDYLLAECDRLQANRPDLSFTLVIAGGAEPDTKELIAVGRKTLGSRVRFLVRFPRLRMPELYRMADVFTLCSLREMMPIALLEATASGLPCVVHNHPIMRWMVGQGGEIADLSVAGGLAAVLSRLCSRPDHRAELGRQSRAHCESLFGRDRVVDQILAYYALVETHHRGRRTSDERRLPAQSTRPAAGSVASALGVDADSIQGPNSRLNPDLA